MTKQREIDILDATIKSLGPDSYLGPWLKESRPSLVADISNDFPVVCQMPGAARAEALDIIQGAETRARAIREDAEKQARDVVEKAYAQAADIRRKARWAVERLAEQLTER
jgi:cell division septum initiation protein DivIVA